jgi:hypothetical protein
MNFSLLDTEIGRLLEHGHAVLEGDLKRAALDRCERHDERQSLEADGIYQFLIAELGEPDMLLGFDWESWGEPNSSSDCLYLMQLGDHRYLLLPPDDLEDKHGMAILGSVRITDPAGSLAQLVTERLATQFDVEGFLSGRLPTSTSNLRPDLVPRQAIKDAYALAVDTSLVWESLVDDLKSLADYKGVAVSIPLAADFDQSTRTRLFDAWFLLTYSDNGEA